MTKELLRELQVYLGGALTGAALTLIAPEIFRDAPSIPIICICLPLAIVGMVLAADAVDGGSD